MVAAAQALFASSVEPRSPAPAAAKVAAAQAPSPSSVAPRSPAPTAQAAVAASTPTAAVAFDATAYAGEAEQALAASPPLVASPSVVGLIANFLRIVNGLGDPLACIIWGSTYGHMAHLTAAKAKSVYRNMADRVLEEDSAARGLAAADMLTVELDAPYMAINGTKPVYFTGKLTATSMQKTMGELEAELLAVYANNFDRSNTRPRRVTVVFAKDFVLTTKNQIQALRILDKAWTNDDNEEDETMMKNCKALAPLCQHEGTVHDCYTVLGLPFLSSSTTAAAHVNGDDSSELDAENNGTEWGYSPAPIAQADMSKHWIQ
ncbi:hypothetical protein B484DRAFT_435561 [Ochromonadaceae sp. CCMP2298]|nr:hypothetical protein B484DRAFT_435561 [Ochromonadaceae sp. CCMP2298]